MPLYRDTVVQVYGDAISLGTWETMQVPHNNHYCLWGISPIGSPNKLAIAMGRNRHAFACFRRNNVASWAAAAVRGGGEAPR